MDQKIPLLTNHERPTCRARGHVMPGRPPELHPGLRPRRAAVRGAPQRRSEVRARGCALRSVLGRRAQRRAAARRAAAHPAVYFDPRRDARTAAADNPWTVDEMREILQGAGRGGLARPRGDLAQFRRGGDRTREGQGEEGIPYLVLFGFGHDGVCGWGWALFCVVI